MPTRRKILRNTIGLGALAATGFGTHAYMTNKYYRGPISEHFDGVRFFVPGRPALRSPIELLKWQLGGGRSVWPRSVPSPFADATPRAESNAPRLTLIGHASFLLQVSGKNILIDPVFSERASPVRFAGPKRVNPPGIAMAKLPRIDCVLVSHAHYDHMDVWGLGQIHQSFGPRMIAPLGNDTIIRNAVTSAKTEAGDWGDRFDLGNGVTVHLLPSYHWSARGMMDRLKSLWTSFLVTSSHGTIYHIADTGYGDGAFFRDVKKEFGAVKLAVIPIGAYEPRWFMKEMHVNPQEAVQIMRDCGAEHAVGHHWGTFQLTNEAHDQPEKDLAMARDAAGVGAERFQAFRPGQVWVG